MFRVKNTRRKVKRAMSPLKLASITNNECQNPESLPQPKQLPELVMEKQYQSLFEEEAAQNALGKPWLRLERGFRLKKYRAFADNYPGLNEVEKELLYKTLVRANDAKKLNSKTQLIYEDGNIKSIKGLKIVKSDDPMIETIIKIDVVQTKKNNYNI